MKFILSSAEGRFSFSSVKKSFFKVPRKAVFKTLLCMKFILILLTLFVVQGYGKAHSQDAAVTLKMRNAKFSRVLSKIEKRTDYRFLYNVNEVAGLDKKVDIDVKDKPVNVLLHDLLNKTGLSFTLLKNGLIIIAPEPSAVAFQEISGKVTDSSGNPLIGVSIKVKGTSMGAVTDAQGQFSLNVPDTAVLVVSYLGYQTKEVPVNGQASFNIVLSSSATELSQVVVVGYGTQRKIDVTGSVAQVDGADISKQASVNAASALQGKVAGVQVTNSGAPGSSPQIHIRGVGTIYGDPNPLYIVDGVWFNDISFLNPSDIKDISILKDASAESIYGIRAANGVVLVTTKSGIKGQIKVNYNGYAGWQHVTNLVKMADASEYATLLNEKSIYSGGNALFSDPDKFGKGTDWYRQILQDAFVTSHQISVNGGGEKSTYNFSLGYLDQDGIVKTNNYKRITASLQNDFQVFDWLKLGYMMVNSASNSNDIPGGIFHATFGAPPIVPVRYKDGSYGDPSDYALGQAISNPEITLDFFNQKSKNYRITGNVHAEIQFLQHFTFKTSFGGEFGQGEVRGYTPEFFGNSMQNSNSSHLTISRAETRNWIAENTLNYKNVFGDHSLSVLLGQGAQRYKTYNLIGSAENVPGNTTSEMYLKLASVTNQKGDTTVTSGLPYSVTDNGDLSTISSYFGRIHYAYKGKYLLTASMRADGSSKFAGSHRWGYFPSVGLGWVISEEGFMQNQQLFNTLKIRGSWGKIGNASVPSNLSVLTVSQGPNLIAVFGNPQQIYTGASITTIVPPTTYWERGVGTDVGLEAAFLDHRLTLVADYYNKKTEKAIFAIPILASLGTSGSSIIGNQADFQNRGFELSLSWDQKTGADFSYHLSGNFSLNNNKVLAVSTGSNPIYAGGAAATGGALSTRTILGQPIGQFYGYQVIGIFQNQDQVSKSPQAGTAKPGDFIYKDTNGDGVISGQDRIPLGNPNPKYIYGLNTSFTYKNFDLSLDFQGVADVSIYNANKGLRYGNENYTQNFFDHRWHGEGTSNTYPSANIGGNQNYVPNSWFVENGSYFRVRNMQLGYTLPTDLVKRWGIDRLRVYANAQNAFNFFQYSGFSPEVGGKPTNAGIDTNVYPLYATYNFGINLTF